MASDVRDLTAEDLDWVLDTLGRRRERIVPYAPRFWRPAAGARAAHATFLGNQIANPEVLTVRTDHGVLFGVPRGDRLALDDLALTAEDLWPSEGAALLDAAVAAADGRELDVVCPVCEPERRTAVEQLGIGVRESWWHRDLDATGPAELGEVAVPGGTGRVVPAPPVYDPGGPVLLASDIADLAALRRLEAEAAARGAVVAVLTQAGGDAVRGVMLEGAGYRRTTDFLTGSLRTGVFTD